MPEDELHTTQMRDLLKRIAQDDRGATDELLRRVAGNLERLARKLLHSFPSVRRWEGTDDVVVNASMRLLRALRKVTPANPRQFFCLATEQIRRELLDLARHYYGAHGIGANHASRTASGLEAGNAEDDPAELADWCEFHERVKDLAEQDREIIGLLYYQELPQEEAARLLDVDVRTIQRRWQKARLKLYELIKSREKR